MRLIQVCAAAAAVLVLGAGCSGDGEPAVGSSGPATTSAPSPTATSSAGAGALDGNGKAVCDAAGKLIRDKLTTFFTQAGEVLSAKADGDSAGERKALRAAEQAMKELAAGLRAEAAKADDAELKAALNEAATEFANVTVDSAESDSAKLESLEKRLQQMCGP